MPSPQGMNYDGAFTRDIANVSEFNLFTTATPVVLTNPTSATDLITYLVPGGQLNGAGRALELFAAGVYNLAAASTLIFTLKLGGVTLATFTTASQATTAVTLAWQMDGTGIVLVPGSAGTMEFHGQLNFDSGATLAAACSAFLDSNTAALTGLNYQAPLLLEIMANLGTGNAGSTITSRFLQVQYEG
jgi:hypothetical protein